MISDNELVKSIATQPISAGGGPLLRDNDRFGISATSLGDLNGDGVGDLVVGASGDDDGGFDRGAVWILFLNTDGTPHRRNTATGNCSGACFRPRSRFGRMPSSCGRLICSAAQYRRA